VECMSKILVVDDEASILKVLKSVLSLEKYDVTATMDAGEALKLIAENEYDLLISDLRLEQEIDGLELLHKAKEIRKFLPVIMITAYGTIDVAVEAMKEGAFDFVCKPFKLEILLETVQNALRHRERSSLSVMSTSGEIILHFGTIVGEAPSMQAVYRLIERVAKTDATVLIEGASGTGKELVAEAIHRSSKRVAGPWCPLNCAALSTTLLESEMFGHVAGAFTGATRDHDGMFIAATKGTLFLDEIGSMDMEVQGKLLRALQERKVKRIGENVDTEVDVRVVAATNGELKKLCESGDFREDLFYRISVIPIKLPELKDRIEDIPLLAQHFCYHQSEALGYEIWLGEGVIQGLMNYSWPGNIRELQNAIACAAALSQDGEITVHDLPPHISEAVSGRVVDLTVDDASGRGRSLREFLRQKEKEYLEQILHATDGNRVKAAEMLGISRATLYRKLPEDE